MRGQMLFEKQTMEQQLTARTSRHVFQLSAVGEIEFIS
jgi:hypothetical protein